MAEDKPPKEGLLVEATAETDDCNDLQLKIKDEILILDQDFNCSDSEMAPNDPLQIEDSNPSETVENKITCMDTVAANKDSDHPLNVEDNFDTSKHEIQIPDTNYVAEEDLCDSLIPMEDLLNQESSEDCAYIHQLPDEILHQIFDYLTLGQLCSSVAQVCHRWCDLVCDPIHWQSLTIQGLSRVDLVFCLKKAPLLKYLNLHARDLLSDEEVDTFVKQCPLLKELHIGFCDFLNNRQIGMVAAYCDNLLHLNMEGSPLVDDQSLDLVSRMKKLTSLNISHCCRVQTEGVETLAQNLSSLTKLNIDGIPNISDNTVFTLVLHQGDCLECLDMDGMDLTDSAIQALSKCDRLTHLHISFSELLTDTALLYIKNMKCLRSLKLRKGPSFSGEGLKDAFTSGHLTKLTSLCLSECVQLHDDGVHALVKCCGKNLRNLEVQWCWLITDVGMESIVTNCKDMETLSLLGLNKINGQSLEKIPESMKKLRELDLQQCNCVIDDTIVDLVRALPQLVAYNYYGERFQQDMEGVIMIK